MKKRKIAHIVSGKTQASTACPNCSHKLDAVTGASLGGPFERVQSGLPRLKGSVTMCWYCGALLIFSDDAGNLRVMTEVERAGIRFAPELENLMEKVKERARKPGDFTKKTYN